MHDADDEDVLAFAKQGYYAFQDYSVLCCLDHFLNSVGQSPSDATRLMLNTIESARNFIKSYSLPTDQTQLHDDDSHDSVVQFCRRLLKDPKERAERLDITRRTVAIRRQIEMVRSQALTAEDLDIVNSLYGFHTMFKCPKLWCNYFATGFVTRQDRRKHVDCHERPFCCPVEGCFASQLGFDAEEKLKTHMSKYHSASSTEVRFPKRIAKRHNIHSAAAAGDVAAVMAFMDSGVDPNLLRRFDKRSPLTIAAKCGHFEVCKQLLAGGAKIFERDASASTTNAPAMQLAIRRGSLDIIYLFLCQPELKERLDFLELSRWTAEACLLRNADVLKLLFQSPVSPDINIGNFDENARQEILSACVYGPSLESLQYLLEQGFSEFVTPDLFFRAERQNRKDLVGLLRPFIVDSVQFQPWKTAENLLSYLQLKPSYLSDEQMEILQDQSPAERWTTAKRYETALAQNHDKVESQLKSFLHDADQRMNWLASEKEGIKMRALLDAVKVVEILASY